MATLYKEFSVAVSPTVLWDKLARVGEVNRFMPIITDCRLEGDQRFCTMADGSKLEETIVSVDAEHRRVAYTITRAPFPIDYHSGSMQVVEDGGETRLVWITDVKPDSLAEQLDPLIDQAIAGVQERLR